MPSILIRFYRYDIIDEEDIKAAIRKVDDNRTAPGRVESTLTPDRNDK
jgi:hypothetical protein